MTAAGAPPSIPLFDLRMEPEDLQAVEAVLRDGRLSAGPRVEELEEVFAAHLGCRHAVALANCTAALHLAYLAVGVGPGDEVIVPAITFVATAAAAVYCDATPVFADVKGLGDLGIDPAEVAAKVGPRTRAVCAVHYAGYAAAVDELRELCDEREIALVEDAAHAPSARLGGRMLGTFGHAGCFSFFSNKVLAAGEGGLLATDDDEVAAAARELRSAPFNHRFDELRAALLLSRMRRMEGDIAARRDLTLRYRRLLEGLDGVSVPYGDADVAQSSCYVMPIVLADPTRQRDVRAHMRERHGVQTSLLYPAVHEFTAYADRHRGGALPNAERVARSEVTLPLFGHMTHEQQDRVVAALTEALAA